VYHWLKNDVRIFGEREERFFHCNGHSSSCQNSMLDRRVADVFESTDEVWPNRYVVISFLSYIRSVRQRMHHLSIKYGLLINVVSSSGIRAIMRVARGRE